MKVLVTGADGQLGSTLVNYFRAEQIEYIQTNRSTLDVTDMDRTMEFITKTNPDVVIHCAAYTNVDQAEVDKELCYKVNVIGSKHVAQACKAIGAKMIYISTDYVFDGAGTLPFDTTIIPKPINYYGLTKYYGEIEIRNILSEFFIVRISWVFSEFGRNFVKTMLSLGAERKEISVVCDQFGSPTYTFDLCVLLHEMLSSDEYGIYHASNKGYCSWYDFACEIFKISRQEVKINPIQSSEFKTKATRPKNSRLDKSKTYETFHYELPDWQDALKRCLKSVEK